MRVTGVRDNQDKSMIRLHFWKVVNDGLWELVEPSLVTGSSIKPLKKGLTPC